MKLANSIVPSAHGHNSLTTNMQAMVYNAKAATNTWFMTQSPHPRKNTYVRKMNGMLYMDRYGAVFKWQFIFEIVEI